MMTEHLSSLALDALDLGGIGADERARATAHLAGCERCRAELEGARAARAHFEREVLPRGGAELLRRHRRRGSGARRALFFAVPLLAAAAGLLLLSWPRGMQPSLHDGIRVKGGGAGLRGFARRGERVFAVSDGATLAEGDDVRFVVEPDGRRFVLIASVDGADHATVYYPFGGAASGAVEGGARVELPGSIRLDAAPGPERVFALYSDAPLEAAPVLDELRALGAGGPDAIRRGLVLDGARAHGATSQATLVFEKARP